MSNKPDLLDHPDLSKVWVSLESAAPTVELEDLLDRTPAPVRRPRRKLRLVAVFAAFLMILFVGTETFGVVSARRAIASGIVVTEGTVGVEIETTMLSEPWFGLKAPLGLHDLEMRPEGIVAIASQTESDQQSWLLTPSGWSVIPDVTYPIDWGRTIEDGLVGGSATNGPTTVFAGKRDALLSLDGQPALWTSMSGGPVEHAAMPGLRSLGFGYIIGGFRLSDGIQDVINTGNGFVAYTGYLQVWDGFEGFSLEPSEAWASLVLTSDDGTVWTAQILSDFAIYQMVPFGEGMLAAAAFPPENDTKIIEIEGVPTEIAVSPVNRLYYSEDGLTWSVVADSPELGKPLLSATSDGTVLVVDEYTAEDRAISTTEVFLVTPESPPQ